MAKLLLTPDSAGYDAQQNPGVLSVELDGGASRYRRDILNGAFRVTASWVCNREKYDYLCAFYRSATTSGSSPFDIDLVLDHGELREYEAHFVPGTLRLSGTRGKKLYQVEASLEVVKPFDPDRESADEAIISAYESAHGGG